MTIQPCTSNRQKAAAVKLVMEAQAQAIAIAGRRLDSELQGAIAALLNHPGKVAVTVAWKCMPTRAPFVFIPAAEAVQGRMGAYTPGDPVLLIDEDGATDLLPLAARLRDLGSPLVGILGNGSSQLAEELDFVLDASVPLGLGQSDIGPMLRSAVVAAITDALAVALMPASAGAAAGSSSDGLSRPASLQRTVTSLMHPSEQVARVASRDSVREVAAAMTEHPLGGACVLAHDNYLEGLITERDLARALYANGRTGELRAGDIMTLSPLTIPSDATLGSALRLLEGFGFPLPVLPVVDSSAGRCLGLVRLLDICQAGMSEAAN